ncbi:hypothetical protein LIER_21979 [Lithospermum erythrorhizon]|uniref:Uncharacterized protein n=1 Tax=Lithospermum erythrorhizon TaxID=34254 RepID=A0AAV3QXV1_LITER
MIELSMHIFKNFFVPSVCNWSQRVGSMNECPTILTPVTVHKISEIRVCKLHGLKPERGLPEADLLDKRSSMIVHCQRPSGEGGGPKLDQRAHSSSVSQNPNLCSP